MRVGWVSVSRQLLRRRSGYRSLVLAVGLSFAVAVLATAFGQRLAQHAREMAVLPAEARLQITVSAHEASPAEDLSALRAIPGVRSASWVEAPLRTIWSRPELFDGPSGRFVGWVVAADENALETLGLRLAAGRAPALQDASAVVVPLVVSRSFLAELGPGAGPGTRLRSVERARDAQIVGVVDDFLSHGHMKTSHSTVLWPMQPRRQPLRTWIARVSEAEAAALVEPVTRALEKPGRFVAVEQTAKMLDEALAPLFGARAVLMMLVAIVVGTLLLGLAAAAAFRVVERRRELGMLRALGAARRDVVIGVLAESTAVTAMGLVAGLAVVLALRGPLSQAIPFFTLRPAMVLGHMVLFFAAGWLASFVPAVRAARVPPSVASR